MRLNRTCVMDFRDVLQLVTPQVHEALKRAVEIGKWADGTVLSCEQRELCMQAVIAYDTRYLSAEERSGYIDRGARQGVCDDEPAVVRIVRDRGVS